MFQEWPSSNAKTGLIIHEGVANLIPKTLLTPLLLEPTKREAKRRIQSNSL